MANNCTLELSRHSSNLPHLSRSQRIQILALTNQPMMSVKATNSKVLKDNHQSRRSLKNANVICG
jgi:hypothetical protein